MPLSVGIIGLPNVGKSTLFSALTKREVKISPVPFSTIDPNKALISIPDERLKALAKITKEAKMIPSFVEFVDIAGLIKNAHKGEGLGNQFLSHIRECDLLVQVLRNFDGNIENVMGKISPEKEAEIVSFELLMKDLQTIENILSSKKEIKEKKDLLMKIKEEMEKGVPIRNLSLNEKEKELIKEYNFLSQKPIIYVLNSKSNENFNFPFVDLTLDLKEELEVSKLSEKELKELNLKSNLDLLIKKCYNKLNLITFYTIAKGKETRAWVIERGESILKAARKIHSDFEKHFKRAEVVAWEELIRCGSWEKAKQEGKIKIVGKDYKIEDGQIIEIKI
jgi:ribosome-binding ATPase YchF (GTP1/OBG family)